MNEMRCKVNTHGDSFATRLETELVCAVFDHANLTGLYVDVSIFALHLTIGSSRFDFEASVGCFVTVCEASIFIVTIYLLENRDNRLRCFLLFFRLTYVSRACCPVSLMLWLLWFVLIIILSRAECYQHNGCDLGIKQRC